MLPRSLFHFKFFIYFHPTIRLHVAGDSQRVVKSPAVKTVVGYERKSNSCDDVTSWCVFVWWICDLISGSKFWRFDPSQKPPVKKTYPKPISNWEGIPDNLDAALQYTNGYTYFFKRGHYYRFNDRTFSVSLFAIMPQNECYSCDIPYCVVRHVLWTKWDL
jgi:hypothetical protein